MLRQAQEIELRILQGRLDSLLFDLEGEGEVTEVEGTNLAWWRVVGDSTTEAGERRQLEVALSRPLEREGSLRVVSQTTVQDESVELLRLIPEHGETRHSGLLRIQSEGAVRFESQELTGLMQLSPEQWDASAPQPDSEAGQVAVFRFPTEDYSMKLALHPVFPEVSVAQVTTYRFTESDGVITTQLELEVREAPLREWVMQMPKDYVLTTARGTQLADTVLGEESERFRDLRLIFSEPVSGRVLLNLVMERSWTGEINQWALEPLGFPEARSVRGFIGVESVPGFRLHGQEVAGLAETPTTFHPTGNLSMQLAFRQREPEWSANIRVEELGQSVAADVFHLHSLREGAAYGSVVLNFFVIGAPVNEWRLLIPEDLGNLSVTGQDVQTWRREGEEVIVSVNRPAMGAVTLLVTFEEALGAQGGTLQLGRVTPLGVASERGFVQLVSPLQVRTETEFSEDLLKLEPNELPAELRLLTSAPSVELFQYASRPFELSIDVEWFAEAEAVSQVVDFARLDTRVARDGQVVTQADYYVKSRRGNVVSVLMPPESVLWEARVDGSVVNARVVDGANLIPLPNHGDLDRAYHVSLRYGGSGGASVVKLRAPQMDAPILATEWRARPDAGRALVVVSSRLMHAEVSLPKTGWEWLNDNPLGLVCFWGAMVGAVILALTGRWAQRGLWLRLLSSLTLLGYLACCAVCVALAYQTLGVRGGVVQIAGAVAGAMEEMSVTVSNLPLWLACLVWPGFLLALAGLGLLVLALLKRTASWSLWCGLLGWVLVSAGILTQRGGGVLVFGWLALCAVLLMAAPLWKAWRGGQAQSSDSLADGGASRGAVTGLVLLLSFFASLSLGSGAVQAQEAQLEMIDQQVQVTSDGMEATAQVRAQAVAGQAFLLLRAPAVVQSMEGDGWRMRRAETDQGAAYFLVAERDGLLFAAVRYSMNLKENTQSIQLPTGPSAQHRVRIERDEPGWEFLSNSAVRVTRVELDQRSGAELILQHGSGQAIEMRPRGRDVSQEELLFYAESAQLGVVGQGVVEGRARFSLRIARGELEQVVLHTAPKLMVGEVLQVMGDRTEAAEWRFDPERQRLVVRFPKPQTGVVELEVLTQQPIAGLPTEVGLAPLRVLDAADEHGVLGIAFTNEAQPETLLPQGLTRVNLDDLDQSLRAGLPESSSLYRVFRFHKDDAELVAQVGAVAPELRVETRQGLSLSEERTVLNVTMSVDIRRAGVFQLSVVVPESLEVESISGPVLSHWTEELTETGRRVTLHLSGRHLGEAVFSAVFTSLPANDEESFVVPKLVVVDASRATGQILVSPEPGLRLRTLARQNASQFEPQEGEPLPPGVLAFRLLQADWRLELEVQRMEPWVTAQMLHEVQVREGQARYSIHGRYRVENASIKSLPFLITGLDPDTAETVRAVGDEVADLVRQEDSDVWELRLRRGILGDFDFTIEYQERLPDGAEVPLALALVEPLEVRQLHAYLALRTSGRLELNPEGSLTGYQEIDWNAVPSLLRQRSEGASPRLAYRLASPEQGMTLVVRRQALADALNLRAIRANLATVFSTSGASATALQLQVVVNEKAALSLSLPAGAKLYQVTVNGEDVAVVRDGDVHSFYVLPSPDVESSALVELAYQSEDIGGGVRRQVQLQGPGLNIPIEDVSWRVRIPVGWQLENYRGSLTLKTAGLYETFGLDEYLDVQVRRRASKAQETAKLIEEAGGWLREGDQARARQALSRASKTEGVDEATHEDARVQLMNLYNQQAMLGLNTRRQRLYLDNRGRDSSVENVQIEQAAQENPLLQGEMQYDPGEFDKFLMGNTLEETSALRAVAERIVNQQIAAEPVPRSIGVSLPERGTELVFERSVQGVGEERLQLQLNLGPVSGREPVWLSAGGMALLAGLAYLATRRRRSGV